MLMVMHARLRVWFLEISYTTSGYGFAEPRSEYDMTKVSILQYIQLCYNSSLDFFYIIFTSIYLIFNFNF